MTRPKARLIAARRAVKTGLLEAALTLLAVWVVNRRVVASPLRWAVARISRPWFQHRTVRPRWLQRGVAWVVAAQLAQHSRQSLLARFGHAPHGETKASRHSTPWTLMYAAYTFAVYWHRRHETTADVLGDTVTETGGGSAAAADDIKLENELLLPNTSDGEERDESARNLTPATPPPLKGSSAQQPYSPSHSWSPGLVTPSKWSPE